MGKAHFLTSLGKVLLRFLLFLTFVSNYYLRVSKCERMVLITYTGRKFAYSIVAQVQMETILIHSASLLPGTIKTKSNHYKVMSTRSDSYVTSVYRCKNSMFI